MSIMPMSSMACGLQDSEVRLMVRAAEGPVSPAGFMAADVEMCRWAVGEIGALREAVAAGKVPLTASGATKTTKPPVSGSMPDVEGVRLWAQQSSNRLKAILPDPFDWQRGPGALRVSPPLETLRDRLAMAAPYAEVSLLLHSTGDTVLAEMICRARYEWADMMLKVRGDAGASETGAVGPTEADRELAETEDAEAKLGAIQAANVLHDAQLAETKSRLAHTQAGLTFWMERSKSNARELDEAYDAMCEMAKTLDCAEDWPAIKAKLAERDALLAKLRGELA